MAMLKKLEALVRVFNFMDNRQRKVITNALLRPNYVSALSCALSKCFNYKITKWTPDDFSCRLCKSYK